MGLVEGTWVKVIAPFHPWKRLLRTAIWHARADEVGCHAAKNPLLGFASMMSQKEPFNSGSTTQYVITLREYENKMSL